MISVQERCLCCFHDDSEPLKELRAQTSGEGTLSETVNTFGFFLAPPYEKMRSLPIYLTAVFSNWNGGGEFCISKELCNSAFLRSSQVRLLTLVWAPQVWHLTLAFPPRAVFEEQVKLNNLANSSKGSTAF